MPCAERRTFREILRILRSGGTPKQAGIARAEQEALERAARAGAIDQEYLGPDFLRHNANAPFDAVFQDQYVPFRYFGQSPYSIALAR